MLRRRKTLIPLRFFLETYTEHVRLRKLPQIFPTLLSQLIPSTFVFSLRQLQRPFSCSILAICICSTVELQFLVNLLTAIKIICSSSSANTWNSILYSGCTV